MTYGMISLRYMNNYKHVLRLLKQDLKDAQEAKEHIIQSEGEGGESHIDQEGYIRGLEWSIKSLELNT